MRSVLEKDVFINMMKTYDTLAATGVKWTHYLWVSNVNYNPQTVAEFKKKGVIVKDFRDLKSITPDIIDIIEKLCLVNLAEAADILRMLIVNELGGVYFDTDVYISEYDLVLHKFDFYGFVHD